MDQSTPRPPSAYCSFCRKPYKVAGPLVEGPDNVYICSDCIELCQDIIDQEKARRQTPDAPFNYYRAKVERLMSVMDEAKWQHIHQIPSLHPQELPAENMDGILQHLAEISRLVPSGQAPQAIVKCPMTSILFDH